MKKRPAVLKLDIDGRRRAAKEAKKAIEKAEKDSKKPTGNGN